jgi:hypothetical protein
MLCGGAIRCGHFRKQLFLETLGAESLTALPAARIADDLLVLIVNSDG